jgi:hypothetical protein
MPSNPPIENKRRFQAMLMPSVDPSIWDRWDYGIGIQAPKFSAAKQLSPGQTVSILVVFSGFDTDPQQHVDLQYSWTFCSSNGENLHQEPWKTAVKGRVLHRDFLLRQMEETSFQIPTHVTPGHYTFHLDAECLISKQHSSQSVTIPVSKPTHPKTISQEEAEDFVSHYLEGPVPQSSVHAYLGLFDTIGRTQPDSFFSALPFFAKILGDNKWLLPSIEEGWDHLNKSHQAACSLLCHAARIDSSHPGLSALISQRAHAPFPSIAGILTNPVTHPQELDFIWSIFLASGHFNVFRKICNALGAMPEAFAAVTPDSTQTAVRRSAAWSIRHFTVQNPLCMTYAMALCKEPNLDPQVKQFLLGMLKMAGWEPNNDHEGM